MIHYSNYIEYVYREYLRINEEGLDEWVVIYKIDYLK